MRRLSEREFLQWGRYASKYCFPQRRNELYLANIARILAETAGVRDVSLEDFLFDPEEVEEVSTLEDTMKAFDFNPQGK